MGFNLAQIVNKYLPVKSIGGIGPLSSVPQGSQNGTPLGTLPNGAMGARLYLGSSDSVAFTIASAQPVYGASTPVKSTVFTGGPVSAVAAGSILQDGWIDNSGSVWDINSSNGVESSNVGASPWNTGMLIRPASEASVNSQITATVVYNTLKDRYLNLRHNGSKTAANCYMGGLKGAGSIQIFKAVNGNMIAPIPIVSQSISGLTAGTSYILSFKAIQNGSSTSLTLTLYASDGVTVLGTATATDSEPVLQNASGRQGALVYWNSGASLSTDYTALSTYTLSTINTYTVSGTNTPNWDELLSNGQMMYITSLSGAPLFRWY